MAERLRHRLHSSQLFSPLFFITLLVRATMENQAQAKHINETKCYDKKKHLNFFYWNGTEPMQERDT